MVFDEKFDVVVIGGGHAGCEAASAAARLGAQTALVTMNLDLIGQMSCNPAVGGIAKGHLVREVDALGGIMGRIIDRAGIQFRLLNRSRGPAVQSPRAQADRALYRKEMRLSLEQTPNLHLRQGTVVDILVKDRRIIGVEMQDGRECLSFCCGYRCRNFPEWLGSHWPEDLHGGQSWGASFNRVSRNVAAFGVSGWTPEDGHTAAAGRKDYSLGRVRTSSAG